MSAPKKGKDLSALKARLAKKAAGGEGEGEAQGTSPQAADVPAPGAAKASVPAPGEVQRPVADIPAPGEVKKAMDIPAPGEVSKPVADLPAPGQVQQPRPAPQGDIADDPMSGGVAFDPNVGLIDDIGDIKPRSGIGLPIFAGLIGVLVGVGLGYMGHRSTESRSRHESARSKAVKIEEKVNEIEATRALISLRVGEAQEALKAKEPEKAIEALSGITATYAELGDVLGWQMGAMDPKTVKAIFSLAEANNNLQLEVGILKGWVDSNAEILAERTKGPASFVVVRNQQGGAVLAEYAGAVCDDIPDPLPEGFKPDALKKCEVDSLEGILEAPAYLIRTEIGGETSLVGAGQAMFLIPNGQMYTYAIGAKPEANAKAYFDIRMGKLDEALGHMVKLKESALEGIEHYVKDPPVNGD